MWHSKRSRPSGLKKRLENKSEHRLCLHVDLSSGFIDLQHAARAFSILLRRWAWLEARRGRRHLFDLVQQRPKHSLLTIAFKASEFKTEPLHTKAEGRNTIHKTKASEHAQEEQDTSTQKQNEESTRPTCPRNEQAHLHVLVLLGRALDKRHIAHLLRQ